ncbi:nuclear condensing complex subunit [Spinellus fusiger]|nr:nuclear condensing complex subunit [Spinellus fusiger]
MAPNRKQAVLESLKTSIPQIFSDAQKPNANHRKYSISLRKLQTQCSLNTPIREGESHDIDMKGETAFSQEVIRNINKVLIIKKREPCADRIIRFMASFLQYTQQQDLKQSEPSDESEEEEESGAEAEAEKEKEAEVETEAEETISSRFVEYFMRHLLKGLTAKNKIVRLRCCQMVALSVNSLGEIDEDIYQELKRSLFERIKDKEASIRIQAATALSRLQSTDTEIDENDGKTIIQKLVWALQHDSSAEVRRVILFNLDQSEETIPFIVERARDVDAINRRVVYLKPMAEIQDFRMIPVQERHFLLKCGLNDRDPMVQKAATKMISIHWIRHADHNLLEFLERIDILEGDSAEAILNAFLSSRIDIVNSIKLDEQFWNNLSSESAFLAKVLIRFLQAKEYDEKLDSVLPEVTRLCFITQNYTQLWRESEKGAKEDYEFIVTQLLDIGKCLDYADEVGRRKIFDFLKTVIMCPDVPDNHLASVVELFKIISLDERDFTRTMVEIISDIQEVSISDDQDHLFSTSESNLKKIKLSLTGSPTKEEQNGSKEPEILKKKLAQLKCLTICRLMLERSEESLQNNPTLYGLLNELIVPSVKSNEAVLLEEGLHCLGLCCCLDKTLGQHNIHLFTYLLQKGHLEIQRKSLMIFFDMLTCYGLNFVILGMKDASEIKGIFEHALDHDDPEMQAIAAQGLSKLMLSRIYQDKDLLILLYFFPSTIDNIAIQQCLSYFFPAYCYSSSSNQALLSSVTVEALEDLCITYDDLNGDEKMVSPVQIADILADWTDTSKVIATKYQDNEEDATAQLQTIIAFELLELIPRQAGKIRKTMCYMLNKMRIDNGSEDQLRRLLTQAKAIETDHPFQESVVKNMFKRFIHKVEKYQQPETHQENRRESRENSAMPADEPSQQEA